MAAQRIEAQESALPAGQPERAPLAPLPRLAISVREAGETIGVGRNTIYALMKSGELPHVKIGKHTAIRLRDLEAFLERRVAQTQATSAAERTLLAAARDAQQQRRYRR